MQSATDLSALVGRFDVANIKLDKCGGLTEGLALVEGARALGLGVMAGNMAGASWAMAPAFLIGQSCQIADLDGPISLRKDRTPAVRYRDGEIWCDDAVFVQRVSGKPYPQYIKRHVFAPLGMDHSSLQQPLPASLAGDMSKGYTLGSGPPQNFEPSSAGARFTGCTRPQTANPPPPPEASFQPARKVTLVTRRHCAAPIAMVAGSSAD